MLHRIFNLHLAIFLFSLILVEVPAHASGWGYSTISNYGGYVESMSITTIDSDDYDNGWAAYVEAVLYEDGEEVDSDYQDGSYEAEVDLGTGTGSQSSLFEVSGAHYEEFDFWWNSYFLNDSYDYTYGGGSPPYISAIDPAWALRGSSGSITINGSYLSYTPDQDDAPEVYLDDTPLQVGSTNQAAVVVQFSNVSEGDHTLTLFTSLGQDSITFTGADPTPAISSIDPSTWYAGTSTNVTISGTGFGTNPSVGMDASGVTWSIQGASDTEIDLELSVASNAPDQTNVTVTVTSNGYGGGQFFYEPQGGGQQSNSASRNAQVQAACGDERDSLIQQYRTDGVNLAPLCSWFTQSAHSAYFQFSELNTNSGSTWALIKQPLTVSASSSYGLDRWRELIGSAQTVNSGYRTPDHNKAVGGATASRHMYGDAADLNNASHTTAEYWVKACAARKDFNATFLAQCDQNLPDARANFVEPLSGPCKLNCVHADWRSTDANIYSQ